MCPFLDYFTSFRRRAKMYKDIRKCWNIFFFFTKFKLLNLWPKLSYLKTKAEYLFTWWRGTLNIHSEQNKIILTLRVAWWNCKLIFFWGGGYSQLFVVISCLFREFLSPAILIFVEISEIKNLLFHVLYVYVFSKRNKWCWSYESLTLYLFIYMYLYVYCGDSNVTGLIVKFKTDLCSLKNHIALCVCVCVISILRCNPVLVSSHYHVIIRHWKAVLKIKRTIDKLSFIFYIFISWYRMLLWKQCFYFFFYQFIFYQIDNIHYIWHIFE